MAPSVAVVGTIAEVTQHNVNGNFTDAAFPTGTPRGALTFSG